MHLAQMETPKSTGIGQNRFAHSQNASHYFSPRGPISSPLATSSPMFPIVGSADRPQHRPPLKPKQPPFSTHPQIAVHHNIIAAGPGPGSDVMSQQRQQQNMASRTNTIRSADLSSIFTMPEEMIYGVRHQELLDLIAAQKNQIEQAAAAIAFCRKKYSYNGTLQELSAQRLLLVSQERLALYNRQLDQLKDHHLAPNKFHRNLEDIPESVDFESLDAEDMGAASVAGLTSINEQNLLYNLFIDKFVLQLNPSFSMKKIDKEASYAFIVLCRYEGCIHATQVANVLDIGELRNNKVKFKELVIFDDLPPDFCVLVEVFAMKIGKRWDHKWQSVWDFAARTFRNLKRTFTYSSGIGTISAGNSGKAGGGNGTVPAPAPSFSASSVLSQQQTMISSEFRRCGYLHLTRDSLALGKEKFFLSDADYPLEGSVEVFARFAASNSPMEPPRPDSASIDLRMEMGGSSMVGGSGL